MRPSLSEKSIVVILFVLVFITFSLAQEDSKKKDQFYSGVVSSATNALATFNTVPVNKSSIGVNNIVLAPHQK